MMQNNYCSSQTFAQITAPPCQGYYQQIGSDRYNLEQCARINRENPSGSWVSDNTFFNAVQTTATSGSGAGAQYAQTMISNYCLIQNPSGWPDIDHIRTLINTWALQLGSTSDNCRNLALGIVNGFCAHLNPTSDHCSCAWTFLLPSGQSPYNACAGNTSNACSEFNQLRTTFSQAPPLFASQVQTLIGVLSSQCVSNACKAVHGDPTSQFLAPGTQTQLQCDQNISYCLESFKTTGSIMPGAQINMSCQQSLNFGSNIPSPTPTPPPLVLSAQAVQQGGTPGTPATLAVVTGTGGTTNVQTTGTPGGGLQQTVTSSSPVGIGSSGGPVSYTSPAPAPTPISVKPSDNTQTYALAAGGGLLGLMSSILFLLFIIIGAILIFGGSKGETAPKPLPLPLAAYGL